MQTGSAGSLELARRALKIQPEPQLPTAVEQRESWVAHLQTLLSASRRAPNMTLPITAKLASMFDHKSGSSLMRTAARGHLSEAK